MAVNYAVTDTRWSPNFSPGRPGSPSQIIIHHWGVDGQSHQGVVDYLCRPGGNSSAHYVVSAGRVTQIVHDYDRAWHSGSNRGNGYGIGVECRPEMSQGDFETVARLVAAIRAQHGDLPLSGHQDWYSTACPGRWYARLGDLDARARQVAAGGGAAPAPRPSWMLDVDGDWGPKTGARFREVFGLPASAPWEDACAVFQYWLTWAVDAYHLQADCGVDHLDVDGDDGPITWRAFQGWWNRCGVPEGHRIDVDGDPGPDTYKAVQIALNHSWAGARALATHP